MNPETSSFVPQGNIRVGDKGINTSPFTIHSVWVTAKRLKREKGDLLGVTHGITFSLTSGTHLAVSYKQL
jgi:hypothetical protein